MIFVTVGTHEQPFNRLIQEMDRLISSGVVQEDVFIQRGIKSIIPRNCPSAEMISFQEMGERIANARIIIIHGGPASIMLCLSNMKIPIVVPRQLKYKEHVDNHQVDFTKRLESQGKVLAVYESEELGDRIADYEKLCEKLNPVGINQQPVETLKMLIENLDRYCQSFIPQS